MKKMVICRVCGYIMAENQLGDVCPACGVKSSVFQPYTDKISKKRRMILDFHLHSISVHFPQAFSILIFFLFFLVLFVAGPLQVNLKITGTILSFFLPFSVVASLLSGLFDGKIRFKKTSTPILKTKIVFASTFLITSLILGYILNFTKFYSHWLVLFLSGLCVLFSFFLGKKGGNLIGLEVPGP